MLTSGVFGYLFDYILWWMLFFSLVLHAWCFFRFFPRPKFRKTGLVVGNLLVFLCLISVVALAGESYFRFAAVETDSFGVSLPARRWFALHAKLNSTGCRDKEWTTDKPSGVRRIAFVGDSFTYGWGIKQPEDRFTDLIQARFDARSRGVVEVMNVAKPGWGTDGEIQPIADMIKVFGVDEVVLCHVANDIEKLLPTAPGFNPTRPPDPTFFNLDSSCLMDYLYRRIYLPRVPTMRSYHDWLAAGYSDESVWRRQQQQLGAIIRNCTDHGVTLRVALLPLIRTSGEELNQAALHATLRRFFEANHVPVVDLLSTIEGPRAEDLAVSRIDAHPNEQAHRLFAEAIWSSSFVVNESDVRAGNESQ
jgi:lysophospholipase L1-like esterase